MLVAYRPVEKGELLKEIPAVMKEMCNKYQKTPSQVAINWLISQDNVVTISKTRNPAHLQENLAAIGWQMEPKDVERLRKEYPGQIAVSENLPLK